MKDISNTRLLVLLAAMFLVVLGCAPEGKDSAKEGAGASSEAAGESGGATAQSKVVPQNVRTAKARLSSLKEVLVVSGATLPAHDVTFAAEIPGRIELLSADLGDTVEKGQLLARVDYAMLKAQRNQARASLDLASKTLGRLKALRADDLISDQQID